MIIPDPATFRAMATLGNVVPVVRRLMSDQITPVQGYRRLVSADERTAPSYLFESVEGGANVGRFSFLGAQPAMEVMARGHEVTIVDHRAGTTVSQRETNPLLVPRRLTDAWRPVSFDAAPAGALARLDLPRFTGGWVGYAAYDTVRYLEPEKLPFDAAPRDDRGLPDLHFGLYRATAVFDHVRKMLYAINHAVLDEHASVDAAYEAAVAELDTLVARLERPGPRLPAGAVDVEPLRHGPRRSADGVEPGGFERAVERARAYIGAGDVFQVVLSQRFARRTTADPFEVYRALRIVNPSPYMIYLQAAGSILVASSPEILCRCHDGIVTNRPLAGTRRRGATPDEDAAMERELLADEKERAEHVMLVDLGRNDVGRVCELASVAVERRMEIERYSHVMHMSSTVTGRLRTGLDGWDALQGTLPVGTVSGAPKVRAMQIIDELEPWRRGPYAGGIGYVSARGDMDMAIALRTIVFPTALHDERGWTAHLQAGAGIVADSVPVREREETETKAAALERAIDLAEAAFTSPVQTPGAPQTGRAAHSAP